MSDITGWANIKHGQYCRLQTLPLEWGRKYTRLKVCSSLFRQTKREYEFSLFMSMTGTKTSFVQNTDISTVDDTAVIRSSRGAIASSKHMRPFFIWKIFLWQQNRYFSSCTESQACDNVKAWGQNWIIALIGQLERQYVPFVRKEWYRISSLSNQQKPHRLRFSMFYEYISFHGKYGNANKESVFLTEKQSQNDKVSQQACLLGDSNTRVM